MSEPLLPLREPLKPPADYPQSRVASHDEALSARRVEGLFLATGALQRGHFLLRVDGMEIATLRSGRCCSIPMPLRKCVRYSPSGRSS